jgi:hypothetical protein
VFGKNFLEEGSNHVGKKWWRNMVHHNFDTIWNGRCKQEKLLAMYKNVYGKLTEKGIEKELDE